MAKIYVLYNPLSGRKIDVDTFKDHLKEVFSVNETILVNMTEVDEYDGIFADISPADLICVCGGDGTINHFVNAMAKVNVPNKIYYYAAGTGNDFLNDLEKPVGCEPFEFNKYMEKLPVITVKGHDYYFVNGIGYGIDGYCCEEADKIRQKSPKKKINYTNIAIKGCIYDYKPTTATVTVDGVTETFKRVWLAPTMNGRFFGGGMMITPDQDRLNKERTVSVLVAHDLSRFKILLLFPSIFKGGHVKYTKNIKVYTGHNINIKFDRPVALQIDGETVLDVTEYSVRTRD